MKIVNGEVVRDGASNPPSTSFSSEQEAVVFGKQFPKWQLGLIVGVSLILFGLKGALLSGIVLGGGYLYSNGASASSAASGGSGGLQRMSTKAGANIRGMSDLPPAPKSS